MMEAPYTIGGDECGWGYYPSANVRRPTAFLTHNNGGVPFAVVATGTSISVRRQGNRKAWNTVVNAENKQITRHLVRFYPTVVVPPIKYVKLFVGLDSMCGFNDENSPGNSMLAELPSAGPRRRYLHIGNGTVSLYELDDMITGYASPVGNNDVTYEFAVGKKNIYLFGIDTYIPKAVMDTSFDDPYNQAFTQLLDRRYRLAPIIIAEKRVTYARAVKQLLNHARAT